MKKGNYDFDIDECLLFNIFYYLRTYRVSSQLHARVKVKSKPHIQAKDYDKHALLKKNDPKKKYLVVNNDAHFLERDAGVKPNINSGSKINKQYQYSKGQAHKR